MGWVVAGGAHYLHLQQLPIGTMASSRTRPMPTAGGQRIRTTRAATRRGKHGLGRRRRSALPTPTAASDRNDGELTDTTDADGRRTTYSYDSGGNQTGETWVGSSPAERITYTYSSFAATKRFTGRELRLAA